MTQPVNVEFETKDGAIIARFRLSPNAFLTDQAYLQAFREVQTTVEEKGKGGGLARLILNFAEMAYIQSMAISGLLRLQSDVRKLGVELRLTQLSEDVAKVLAIMNLDKHFSIFPTEEEALA
ncbi:MAG: STAS domain-containing protein [Planctomycetota bacterium]|jgi:anti-anti-sigma factor